MFTFIKSIRIGKLHFLDKKDRENLKTRNGEHLICAQSDATAAPKKRSYIATILGHGDSVV